MFPDGKVIVPDLCQMIDANQRWDVGEAITWVSELAQYKPLWIEEPTSPDDILGHATISKVTNSSRMDGVLEV